MGAVVKKSRLSPISAKKLAKNGGKTPYSTLAKVSKKQAKDNRQRSKDAKELTAGGVYVPCEIRSPVCTGEAGCFDERLKRAHQGSTTDKANRINACTFCNSYKEDHPNEAIEKGWTESPTPVLHAIKTGKITSKEEVDAFDG
jgi:hypothetical protein